MKISTVYKRDELNALFIEHEDLNNWNTVVCNLCGNRFDHVFILPELNAQQLYEIKCHCKGKIYECRDLYE